MLKPRRVWCPTNKKVFADVFESVFCVVVAEPGSQKSAGLGQVNLGRYPPCFGHRVRLVLAKKYAQLVSLLH